VAYGPGQAYSPQPAQPQPMGPQPMGPQMAGPVVNPFWLASNADRERTVGVLRAGFTEGRLSQDELDERVGQAYAARTYAELWALAADLPAGPLPYPPASPYHPALPYDGALSYPQGADGAAASTWQSAATLLITALVIFTLAALVTAILTAHGQTGMLTQNPQQAVLTPVLTPIHAPVAKPAGPAQFQHLNLLPVTHSIKG
jgi:hypothetical protein